MDVETLRLRTTEWVTFVFLEACVGSWMVDGGTREFKDHRLDSELRIHGEQ